MTSNTIKEIYEKKLAKEVQLEPNDGQLQFLLKWVPDERSAAILDAGCGNGKYSRHLAKMGYQNLSAVDLYDDRDMPGIRYQQASIDQLPHEDQTFDFVFCNSVIFYVNPPTKALEEFHRVLKPGGLLMFTALNRWSPFAIERILKRRFLKNPQSTHLQGISFLSAGYYQRALEQTKFHTLTRDGWKFSWFLYPRYCSIALRVKRWFGLQLPLLNNSISSSRLLGLIKSELSYHSVFIAKKQL